MTGKTHPPFIVGAASATAQVVGRLGAVAIDDRPEGGDKGAEGRIGELVEGRERVTSCRDAGKA